MNMKEEAREKIAEVLCPWYEYCNTRKQYGCFTKREHWELCRYIAFADAILALEGEDWRIAVVEKKSYPPDEFTGHEHYFMLKAGWVKEVV